MQEPIWTDETDNTGTVCLCAEIGNFTAIVWQRHSQWYWKVSPPRVGMPFWGGWGRSKESAQQTAIERALDLEEAYCAQD